jgi:hypothetical protein
MVASAGTLADYSGAATSLFNNMRAPAALIGGSLVPIGILSAPTIQKDDSKAMVLLKKANIIIAVASLLSEIMAVVYSSIAINKIAGKFMIQDSVLVILSPFSHPYRVMTTQRLRSPRLPVSPNSLPKTMSSLGLVLIFTFCLG